MYQLSAADFPKLAKLFAPLDHHLAVAAVIRGATPGVIYVDNPWQPSAAMLRVHQRFYFSGDPDNLTFNQQLQQLFRDEIYPAAQAAGCPACTFYFAPGWQRSLEEKILLPLDPIPGRREYYRLRELKADWRALLPAGFQLQPVDRALTENQRLTNLDDLLEELQSERSSVDEFLERSFGFVVLDGDRLVSWCLSEYNLDQACEIGIATDAAYRRRGFATITGAACVEHALKLGINQIGWHCWTDNQPSRSAALKIGYELAHEELSYFMLFHPAANLAVHGEIELNQGNYAAAMHWLERSLGCVDIPAWAYFDAACASARLDEPGAAFQYLDQAIAHGFRNLEYLRTVDHLHSLHDLPAWAAFLQSLE